MYFSARTDCREIKGKYPEVSLSPPHPPFPARICEELEKGRYENVSNGGYGKVSGSV
jgi:hypothetical protein